jgi:hypothetical protein
MPILDVSVKNETYLVSELNENKIKIDRQFEIYFGRGNSSLFCLFGIV